MDTIWSKNPYGDDDDDILGEFRLLFKLCYWCLYVIFFLLNMIIFIPHFVQDENISILNSNKL